MRNTLLLLAVLGIALVGALLFYGTAQAPEIEDNVVAETPEVVEEMGDETTMEPGPEMQPEGLDVGVVIETGAPHATITYSGSSYQPSSVTISVGQTVRFVNNASSSFWPASNPHPTHEAYAGTVRTQHCPASGSEAFDACQPRAAGESWDFTFEKAGTWSYHDHMNASARGTITVTQ